MINFITKLAQAAAGNEIELRDESGKTCLDLSASTYLFLPPTSFLLSSASGYKNYNCWTIYYFLLNYKLDHSAYISLFTSTPKPSYAQTVSFIDRKDLTTLLTTTKSNPPMLGFDLDVKLTNTDTTNDLNIINIIYKYHRTISTTTNLMSVTASRKNFKLIEKQAFQSFGLIKKVTVLGKRGLEVKDVDLNSIQHIIIIPAGVQSLLTLYNVKQFLIDQKYYMGNYNRFIESEVVRRQGDKKPNFVEIYRDPKKLNPVLAKKGIDDIK